MWPLLEYNVWAKHFEEAHDKTPRREAESEEAVSGRLPSPIFTTLQYSAADIVCGPEFHISGICLRRRYTQAYLPAHKATHHWSKKFEKQLKESSSLSRFAAHSYFPRLGNKGLTFVPAA